jgi:hypothetical protein
VPQILLDPPRNAFPSFEPSEFVYSLTLSLLPLNATAQVYAHTISGIEVDSEGYLIIDRFRESDVSQCFLLIRIASEKDQLKKRCYVQRNLLLAIT